jgi:hypothetical protein
MRIRMSPGNERIIIVSVDGCDKRITKPSIKPKNTQRMVNARSKLSRRAPKQLEQH